MIEELGSKITHKTTYDEFSKLCKGDPRFDTITSRAEKDILFHEKVAPLKLEFKKRHSEATENFKELIKGTESIDHKSRWSKIKNKLYDDPRYGKDILSSDDRENIFDEYVDELKSEIEKKEQEERERKERHSFKLREEETRKQREKGIRTLEREKKRKAKLELEKNNFKALIAEYVQTSKIRYDDFLNMIIEKNDPRIKTEELNDKDKEDIFYERLESLRSNVERDFERMLLENNKIDLNSKWEDIAESINQDSRFLSVRQTQRQELFNKHMYEIKRDAERNFFNMLRDFPKLNGTIKSTSEEFPVVLSMLRGDQRWRLLDVIPERRIELYDQFIDKMKDDPDSIVKRRRDELRRDR